MTAIASHPDWSDAFLDPFRTVADPLADEVVKQVYAQRLLEPANQLFKLLVRNDALPEAELPPPLRDYLHRTAALPDWADRDLIRHGERVFGEHALQVVTALFCASLPCCYAASRGVQVLHLTARLETDPRRRIIETAQFVVDVMAGGGLEAAGRGIRSAQKVRLMHAAIRHLIAERGGWNSAWGIPINQEDMALTLLTFSHVVLASLNPLGIALAPADQSAYLHVWNVVGHLLGVDERLMAHTPEAAASLFGLGLRRHVAPSVEGRELTQALLAMLEYTVPGTVFDGFPATLMRHLVGDRVADAIGVPQIDWTRHLTGPLRRLVHKGDELPNQVMAVARLVEVFNRKLIDGLLWVDRGPGRLPFALPEHLGR